jgi:iron complex outermembrane receptor protein
MNLQQLLFVTTASGALVLGAGTALAQTAPASAPGGIVVEELIVTAQPHETNLESAPVAVTTFKAEERNLIGANTVRDMITLTPGVYLSDTGVNMRGIGRQNATTLLGSDNGVAYYVNGFYNVDYNTVGESTLFGGNVQFLRGPQGTEWGRDAIGGASNLISRRPTKTFMGEALVGYGRYDWSTVGVTVAGPINDRYRVRLGIQSINQGDSASKNIAPHKAGYDVDNFYAEFQLEGDVTDNLHFLLRSTTFSYLNTPVETAPGRYNTTGFQGALAPNPTYQYGVPSPTEPRQINIDQRGADRLTGNQVHILNADWNLGPATLYYVGGVAQYKSKGYSDFDNTSRASYVAGTGPGQIFVPSSADPTVLGVPQGTVISTNITANYYNRNQYFSHELRLVGNDHEHLEWNLGAYYLKTNYNERYWEAMPDVPQLASPIFGTAPFAPALANPDRAYYQQHNILRQQSAAVFGQATWHIDDVWSLTGGLRYTVDAKRATTQFRYVFWDPRFGVAFESTPQTVAGDIYPEAEYAGQRLKIHNDGYTGRLGVQYQPNSDLIVYANYALGYKAGSFTLGDATANNITRPEKLNSYEVGAKYNVTPRLRGEASVFYYDYRDFQAPITAFNPATGGSFAQFTNIPKSEIYGIELEGDWSPTDALWLQASYTYLHARIKEFCCAIDNTTTPLNTPRDLAGNRMPRTPENKASLAGTYTWTFAPGSVILGGSVAYQSSWNQSVFDNPLFEVKGYTLVNSNLTWRAASNKYDLVLGVTNLTNKLYDTSIDVGGSNVGFATTHTLGGGRFYNLQLRYRF